MPRQARRLPEGSVQHLIARCVNGEFLLDSPGVRTYVLEKLGEKLAEHDCCLFAYSVMSNHIHLAALIGKMRLDRLLQGLLCGTAMRINVVRNRIGHAFANRFTNHPLPRERVGYLVSYIHNNEQRANVVDAPRQSRWSSHRAYVGLAPRPDWLDVGLGLELCGFEDTARGLHEFDQLVVSRSGDPRQADLSLPDAELTSGELSVQPDEAVGVACELFDLSPGVLQDGSRSDPAPQLRAATLLAWCDGLGRRAIEMVPHLGVTTSAASRAMARARDDARTLQLAEHLLDRLLYACGGVA